MKKSVRLLTKENMRLSRVDLPPRTNKPHDLGLLLSSSVERTPLTYPNKTIFEAIGEAAVLSDEQIGRIDIIIGIEMPAISIEVLDGWRDIDAQVAQLKAQLPKPTA
jgi:hypothetical protein